MTDTNASASLGRRGFLAAGTATALTLAGCTGSTRGDTLRVSTWSGTNEAVFKEMIKPRYEEATGNTLDVVGNWQGILSKVRQSPADDPPFDVTVGGSRINYQGGQDDLWEPVRYDELSHADQIKPRLREFSAAETAVPVAYGVHCYVYDEDAVDFRPDSWGALLEEDAPEVTLPSDFWLKVLMMAAIVSDEEPLAEEVYDPDNAEALIDVVEQMPVSTFYQGAQGLWTNMTQGLAPVGHYFFAYGLQKDRTTDSLNVGVSVPERTSGYVDYYQITRGSGKQDAAEEFLDFLLRPEIQSAYAEEFNLGMANTETDYPELTEQNVPTTDEELSTLALRDYSRVAEFAADLSERYQQMVRQA